MGAVEGIPARASSVAEIERTKELVAVDPLYYRPTEVEELLGNPAKAAAKLTWKPETKFADLVSIMAQADWESGGAHGTAHNSAFSRRLKPGSIG